MIWYIARRVLQMIPVFLGATLLVYAMAFYAGGDPIAAIAGDKPLSPAVVAQLRAQYNLDKPLIVQWLIYLGNLVRGDLGISLQGRPIADSLQSAFPVTFRMALIDADHLAELVTEAWRVQAPRYLRREFDETSG